MLAVRPELMEHARLSAGLAPLLTVAQQPDLAKPMKLREWGFRSHREHLARPQAGSGHA